MEVVFQKMFKDLGYPTLLLASLSLVEEDFFEFLDAYIKDGRIVVYAKQKTRGSPDQKILTHSNYISHFIDRDEDFEYVLIDFSFPQKCKKFLQNLEDTESTQEALWIELFKLLKSK